jgi:hypothetical protein
MSSKLAAVLLGALTGIVGLLGMARLVAGAFSGPSTGFTWGLVLLAMVPWVLYVAWRAVHGRFAVPRRWAVLALTVIGMVSVWLSTIGPVIALVCSLAAFAVIWVSDWPDRRPSGQDRFVPIEELSAEDLD